MCMSLFPCTALNLVVTLSSSSIFISLYGITPRTGTFIISSSIFIPSSKNSFLPLNLFIITPLTLLLSSSLSSIIVPASDANTPPLSISPTIITGASAISAIPILAISCSLRFISAVLPAPSITTMS